MNVRKVDSVQIKDREHPLGKWTGVLQEEGRQINLTTPKEEDLSWDNNQPEDLHQD